LSIKYLKEALKYKKLYFSIDCKNFRFIFLFIKRFYPSRETKLDSSQLKWLKKKVNTDKKIIIFFAPLAHFGRCSQKFLVQRKTGFDFH